MNSPPGQELRQDPAAEAPRAQQKAYRDLRKLPIFDGIPNDELWRIVLSGGMERRTVDRDVFVADPTSVDQAQPGSGAGARIYLVMRGQISVAVFPPDVLSRRLVEQDRFERMTQEERQELSLLKPPPLAHEALKNLATFMVGDLFNSAALSRGRTGDVAFYSVEPSVIAVVTHASIADLAARFPFFEERVRRAIEASRDRLRNIAGVKQEILDFFIRHGISVSGEMVRVRQLDSCIDCKLCEEACEERYGSKRLTLGGFQLGMLDFVFTCRTCTDQRCIDPCEYDSIRFDADIREVVINESSCVGCTLCARACPYAAIEMVDIEDPSNPTFSDQFRLRLDAEGHLGWGPGQPRVARPRRIANKCDHCMRYYDQACVSACPTGSLIEVSAYDLFQERSPMSAALSRTGYDVEAPVDHSEILPTEPFTKGVGVRDAGMAKIRRGRLAPVVMWGLAVAAWLLALAEILLRTYKPESSLEYVLLRSDGLSSAIARVKVDYNPGSELAVYCGFIGTGLMLLAVLYIPLRRLRGFRRIASNTMWFDFHLMAGTMGPAFILLHSALNFRTYAAGAFWCMAIVFLSGVIGRYLYTQVPDLLDGRVLEELDHERAFNKLRMSYPQALAVVDSLLQPHAQRVSRLADEAGLFAAFWWLILEDLKRPSRWLQRRRLLRGTGINRRVVSELSDRTGRMLLIQRRKVIAPRAQLILHSWKKVHVPFSIIMTALAVHHVWLELPKAL